ncbi:MAG: hypothetical protein DRO05_06155 [Thermoproteota archaeon]|nr:MAG: hypothetical protein DRO05_06155 [Candidatus Korarchaeota archaeon]
MEQAEEFIVWMDDEWIYWMLEDKVLSERVFTVSATLVELEETAMTSLHVYAPEILVVANNIDITLNYWQISRISDDYLILINNTWSSLDQLPFKAVLVLGGPDPYEGVGDFVRRVLPSNYYEQMRTEELVLMTYVNKVPVIVAGGPTRNETARVVPEAIGLLYSLLPP